MIPKIPKLILVDYGIANHFGDHIEINRELINYPDLFQYVVKHEVGHTDKLFTSQDLAHDFRPNFRMTMKLLLFTLKRPKTWYELSPIVRREGRIIYDINMIISYLILVAVLTFAGIYFF